MEISLVSGERKFEERPLWKGILLRSRSSGGVYLVVGTEGEFQLINLMNSCAVAVCDTYSTLLYEEVEQVEPLKVRVKNA
jgi:hypothetical protein